LQRGATGSDSRLHGAGDLASWTTGSHPGRAWVWIGKTQYQQRFVKTGQAGHEDKTVIKREDILLCYEFLLDRSPENESVVDEKCQAKTLEAVVGDMVAGAEFMKSHKVAIARYFLANSHSK
jgi:hypothetical protein